MKVILVTKAEWNEMYPMAQGYIIYMQGDLPGSELKGLSNPYRKDSIFALAFAEGERIAVLEVQDGEE